MAQFRVGMIGCGRPWRMEGAKGTGIGNVHANGYTASPDCEIVAAADLDQSNLDSFCRTHHIANGYQSHKEMLEKENLDIVGVTLGPSLHAQLVIDAARAGVKAVHCEKPMAMTWGDARKMAAVCEENGVQLTFNHQRRYSAPYAKAKELLDAGAIGKLTRVDACCPDLLHWGTHWFDIMMFYNHDEPAAWVMGQMEALGGYGGREAAEGQGVQHGEDGVHLRLDGAVGGVHRADALVCELLVGQLPGDEAAVVPGADAGEAFASVLLERDAQVGAAERVVVPSDASDDAHASHADGARVEHVEAALGGKGGEHLAVLRLAVRARHPQVVVSGHQELCAGEIGEQLKTCGEVVTADIGHVAGDGEGVGVRGADVLGELVRAVVAGRVEAEVEVRGDQQPLGVAVHVPVP